MLIINCVNFSKNHFMLQKQQRSIISLLKRKIGFVSYRSKNAKKTENVTNTEHVHCPQYIKQINITFKCWVPNSLSDVRLEHIYMKGPLDTYRPSTVGAHSPICRHTFSSIDHQHLVLNSNLVFGMNGMLQVCHTFLKRQKHQLFTFAQWQTLLSK